MCVEKLRELDRNARLLVDWFGGIIQRKEKATGVKTVTAVTIGG